MDGLRNIIFIAIFIYLCLIENVSSARKFTCKELAAKKHERSNSQRGTFISVGFPPQEVSAKFGSTAKFTCNHIGLRGEDPVFSPEVELHWFKGRKELKSDHKINIDECNKKPFIYGTNLRISNVTREDVGNYSCILWKRGKFQHADPVFKHFFLLRIAGLPEAYTTITVTQNYSTTVFNETAVEMAITKAIISGGAVLALAFFICCVYLCRQGPGRCSKLFEKQKKDTVASEVSVYFHRDSTANARSQNSNLLFGCDSIEHCNPNALYKKYSSVSPFITESDIEDILKLEIQRERLQCNMEHSMPIILGSGNFGQVYAGTVINSKNSVTPVAVKRLNDGSSLEDLGNFLREVLTIIKSGQHLNVISLIATIVLDTLEESITSNGLVVQRPPILIMELATGGNLRKFLHDNRFNFVPSKDQRSASSNKSSKQVLELKSLLSFGYQVARGMEHLSSRNILHRDLAARNILLTDQLVVKIADFGLSKFVTNSKQYYRINNQGITPAKWTAPESLWSNKFTVKSDVWSYGVLLWEILTFGDQPYDTVPACKLYEYLAAGNRLKKPVIASLEIYSVMLECWSWDPTTRPDFPRLVDKMDELLLAASNQSYIDLASSKMQMAGCTEPRDSEASISYSTMTESTSCDSAIEMNCNHSVDSDPTVKEPVEEIKCPKRNSGIIYEIMNPLYEGKVQEDENVQYVNEVQSSMDSKYVSASAQ